MNTSNNISEIYEGFTVGLALVDMLPVLIFGCSCLVIGGRIHSALFVIGAVLTILGGMCKVCWKLLLATIHRDIHFLNRPLFPVLMLSGFLIMVFSVILAFKRISWGSVLRAMIQMPSLIFFVLGVLGLCAMTVFFRKHDKTNARNNWVEQFTNIFSQSMILLGLWFMS